MRGMVMSASSPWEPRLLSSAPACQANARWLGAAGFAVRRSNDPVDPSMPPHPSLRFLAPAIDIVSGLACLVVWIAPLAFGADAVKTVVAMMVMEFVLVHGAGFFAVIPSMADMKRWQRAAATLGLAAFYLLFVLAICLGFGQWWPLLVFAWLVGGKLLWIAGGKVADEREVHRQVGTWAFSVVVYMAAVFGGVMLPLPYLGLAPEVVAGLQLPGGGEWIERPHTAVAGMAFYFLALAAFKALLARRRG